MCSNLTPQQTLKSTAGPKSTHFPITTGYQLFYGNVRMMADKPSIIFIFI